MFKLSLSISLVALVTVAVWGLCMFPATTIYVLVASVFISLLALTLFSVIQMLGLPSRLSLKSTIKLIANATTLAISVAKFPLASLLILEVLIISGGAFGLLLIRDKLRLRRQEQLVRNALDLIRQSNALWRDIDRLFAGHSVDLQGPAVSVEIAEAINAATRIQTLAVQGPFSDDAEAMISREFGRVGNLDQQAIWNRK
jgi:hypothetical protein